MSAKRTAPLRWHRVPCSDNAETRPISRLVGKATCGRIKSTENISINAGVRFAHGQFVRRSRGGKWRYGTFGISSRQAALYPNDRWWGGGCMWGWGGLTTESACSCELLLRQKTTKETEVTIPCVVLGLLKNI